MRVGLRKVGGNCTSISGYCDLSVFESWIVELRKLDGEEVEFRLGIHVGRTRGGRSEALVPYVPEWVGGHESREGEDGKDVWVGNRGTWKIK